jgi:hypothetical protein
VIAAPELTVCVWMLTGSLVAVLSVEPGPNATVWLLSAAWITLVSVLPTAIIPPSPVPKPSPAIAAPELTVWSCESPFVSGIHKSDD